MKIALIEFHQDRADALGAAFPAVDFVNWNSDAPLPADTEAIIGVSRGSFDRVFQPERLAALPDLRWVHAPGAGIEAYLFPGLTETPFVMTNGKIIQGPEVAEQALALALCLTRRIGQVLKGIPRADIPRPIELRGKVATVIGMGGIGLGLAEKLAGLGMVVDGVTELNPPLLGFLRDVYYSDQLHLALARADLVFMCAPNTPRSRGMLNAAAFAAMKPGAYVINVSRGPTIDTGALTDALRSGHLAGAGLDVTDPEPLGDDHPLRAMPNVLITPHMAGVSDQLAERQFDLICTNIRRVLAGLPLVNVVDKHLSY